MSGNDPGTFRAQGPGYDGGELRARPAVAARSRRSRLGPTVVLLAALGVTLALVAAAFPLARMARLSATEITGGIPFWAFLPFGIVGLLIAWRRPANPLG